MDVPCESAVQDVRLGRTQKTETREILCPLQCDYRSRQDFYKAWLQENVQLAEGEESSFYLGSRSSIVPKPDGVLLRYPVRSWPINPTSTSL